MARLREALNDSVAHPRFIETLPKHGYRFIASVLRPAAPRPRLVVLPFVNLSGDPAKEYFSDAVTEEIIGQLAGLAPEQLAVIARTTAMHFKGSQKDVSEIGRELAVDYVVEGSLRQADERIVMSAQLIQASDQTHLWANRYDAELREVFSIESAVVKGDCRDDSASRSRAPPGSLPRISRPTTFTFRAVTTWRGPIPRRVSRRQSSASRKPLRGTPSLRSLSIRSPNFTGMMGFFGFTPPKEALSAGNFSRTAGTRD